MRVYLAPAFWLAAGALTLLRLARTSRPERKRSLSTEQREGRRRVLGGGTWTFFTVAVGLLCAFGTVRTVVAGSPAWWLWAVATATHAVGILARRNATARLGPTPSGSPPGDRGQAGDTSVRLRRGG